MSGAVGGVSLCPTVPRHPDPKARAPNPQAFSVGSCVAMAQSNTGTIPGAWRPSFPGFGLKGFEAYEAACGVAPTSLSLGAKDYSRIYRASHGIGAKQIERPS